ncbi:MAG: PfkB family carbohydrate kinase, partial [Pirellulaceae bacterium]
RGCGTDAMIGITLGDQGALLSPAAGEWLTIEPLPPPGNVVDTTAAGDSFLAGFIAGSVQGLSAGDSGRLAAATGACCVTGLGVTGIRSISETMKLAGLE